METPFPIELDEDAALSLQHELCLSYQQMARAIKQVCEELYALYGRPSSGDYRHVYFAEDLVYKVPASSFPNGRAMTLSEMRENIKANYREAAAFTEGYDGMPVANCEIIHHANGLPIVVMERVDQASGETPPDWAHRADFGQVGKNKEGNWVVFDASDPPLPVRL